MAYNQNQMPHQMQGQVPALGQMSHQQQGQVPAAQGQVPAQGQMAAPFVPQEGMLSFDDIDPSTIDPSFFDEAFFLEDFDTNGTEPFPDFINANANDDQLFSEFTNGNDNGNQSFSDLTNANANGDQLFPDFTNPNGNLNNPSQSASYFNAANANPSLSASHFTTANPNSLQSPSYFSMVNQFGSYPLGALLPNTNMQPGAVDADFGAVNPNTNIQPSDVGAGIDELDPPGNANANVGPFDNVVPFDPNDEQFQSLEEIPSEHGDEEPEQLVDNVDDDTDEHDSLFDDDETTLIDGTPSPKNNDDINDNENYGEDNIDNLPDEDDRVDDHDDVDNGDHDSGRTLTAPDSSVDEEEDESEVEEQDQPQDAAAPAARKTRKARKQDDTVFYDDVTHHLPALMNSPNLTDDQKARMLQCIPEHLVVAMYSRSRVPATQQEIDDNMTEDTYRPEVPHQITVPVSTAYPTYTGHFKTKEQARFWRKRTRFPAKNQAPDVDRVKKYGRSFWVREIYNAMIDTTTITDGKASIHRSRFLNPFFLPEDLESVAHHLFDSCISVHERGFNRPQVYHKKAVRGKLRDGAEESIELRLSKLCACLRKSKASADDAIRGGVTLSLLCDNPAAREFTKQSNNAGNEKRGERLRLVKEVEPKKEKVKKEKKMRARKGAAATAAQQQEGQDGGEQGGQ